jgi:hypothetical protein
MYGRFSMKPQSTSAPSCSKDALTAVDGRAEALLSSFELPRLQADDAQVVVSVGVLRMSRARSGTT